MGSASGKVRCKFLVFIALWTFSSHVLKATGKSVFYGSNTIISRLVDAESKLSKSVEEYVEELESRLNVAKMYLEDHRQREKGYVPLSVLNETARDPVGDPVFLYKLIEGFTNKLHKLEKSLHKDHERKILKLLELVRKNTQIPNQEDFTSAIEGLVRIQDAYDMNIREFSAHKNGTTLNAEDCLVIGKYSLNAKIYTRAVEWLEWSLYLVKVTGDQSISLDTVWRNFKIAIHQHNEAYRTSHSPKMYLFQDPIDITSLQQVKFTKRKKILDSQPPLLYETNSIMSDLTNFATLCRGAELRHPEMNIGQKCYLQSKKGLNIVSPLRIEVLHRNPRIVLLHDVLTDHLISELLASTKRVSLERSKVHEKYSSSRETVSPTRTSTTTWITENSTMIKLLQTYKRLQEALELKLDALGALETFQVSKYNPTAHYNPHLDNIMTPEYMQDLTKDEISKGDRLATLMFYLSDGVSGGMTAFPRLGLTVQPKKGSALFWFNMKTDGSIQTLSLHGGCPVIYGTKWIGNQWIRANSQMFSRPCKTKS